MILYYQRHKVNYYYYIYHYVWDVSRREVRLNVKRGSSVRQDAAGPHGSIDHLLSDNMDEFKSMRTLVPSTKTLQALPGHRVTSVQKH